MAIHLKSEQTQLPMRFLLCQAAPPGRTLPSDALLKARLFEVGESLGWTIVVFDADEGLFIWRLRVKGIRYPTWDARFAWHMKRSGDRMAVNDPMMIVAQDRDDQQLAQHAAPELQAEFSRRLQGLVGPIPIEEPDPATYSADICRQTRMDR